MNIVDEVKILLAKKRMTMTELARQLGIRLNKKYTLANFSAKLHNNTLKYSEMKIIAEILGCEVIIQEK